VAGEGAFLDVGNADAQDPASGEIKQHRLGGRARKQAGEGGKLWGIMRR